MVKEIKTMEEWKKFHADAGDAFVIVDFTATWCGPCKMIGPEFVKLAEEFTNIKFIKVDVDENEEVAADQGISAMPTFKVYQNGKVVEEMVGASKEKLRALCVNRN